MKLLNLTLDNFKGTKHFSLDLPNGCSATVYGENGTGKTTLVDAWCWLLYGIDSAGSSDSKNGGFQVLPTETSGLQASVRAVIEKDGETHTLQRVYQEDFTRKTGEPEAGPSKSHTRFYVDDVPLKTKKQYDDYISTLFPSRELGLALTIPSYFPKVLPPDIRRDMLLKIFSQEIMRRAIEEGRTDPRILHRLEVSHFGLQSVKDMLAANDLSNVSHIYLLHVSRQNGDKALFEKEIRMQTGIPVTVF